MEEIGIEIGLKKKIVNKEYQKDYRDAKISI